MLRSLAATAGLAALSRVCCQAADCRSLASLSATCSAFLSACRTATSRSTAAAAACFCSCLIASAAERCRSDCDLDVKNDGTRLKPFLGDSPPPPRPLLLQLLPLIPGPPAQELPVPATPMSTTPAAVPGVRGAAPSSPSPSCCSSNGLFLEPLLRGSCSVTIPRDVDVAVGAPICVVAEVQGSAPAAVAEKLREEEEEVDAWRASANNCFRKCCTQRSKHTSTSQ